MGCVIDYLVNLYPNDPTAFWTMCLVGVTILLILIAGIQLRTISKTGSADFAHRFKKLMKVYRERSNWGRLEKGILRGEDYAVEE